MAYYNWEKACVEPVVINSDDAVQDLIIAGYHSAVDYVTNQFVPTYSPPKTNGEISEYNQIQMQRLMHIAMQINSARDELAMQASKVVSRVQDLILEANIPAGTAIREHIVEDAPIPKSTVRVKDNYDLDYKKVSEQLEKRNLSTQFIETSRSDLRDSVGLILELTENEIDISSCIDGHSIRDVPALLDLAEQNEVNIDPFMAQELNVEKAAEFLEQEHGVPVDAMKIRKLKVTSFNTISSKNDKAKEYAVNIKNGVKKNLPDFITNVLNENEIDFQNLAAPDKEGGVDKQVGTDDAKSKVADVQEQAKHASNEQLTLDQQVQSAVKPEAEPKSNLPRPKP